MGKLKSLVLALARLALASAFLYVGWEHISRIAKRDYAWYQEHSTPNKDGSKGEEKKDGHDSNWLLVQFFLAVPLFLGLRTDFVSRLISASCLFEALFSWDFWNVKTLIPEHARTHFVVNLACCGGLLLLQLFGAGSFSFDSWLLPKKIV